MYIEAGLETLFTWNKGATGIEPMTSTVSIQARIALGRERTIATSTTPAISHGVFLKKSLRNCSSCR
jgi:hypothetical protein